MKRGIESDLERCRAISTWFYTVHPCLRFQKEDASRLKFAALRQKTIQIFRNAGLAARYSRGCSPFNSAGWSKKRWPNM